MTFDDDFRRQFAALIAWRRDVRRIRPDPIDPRLVDALLDLAVLAPSVGNSQPWRFVLVDDPERGAAVIANFERCNRDALARYDGDRAGLYATLKLQGLRTAPVHLGVFCDETTGQGLGLGRQTMPEALSYSVVAAIQTLWLAARAHGLGVGWVSILDPVRVAADLDVPAEWRLVAYLCLGWPEEEHLDPELARHGWQDRTEVGRRVLRR